MKSLKEALVLDGKSDEITGEGCHFHFLTHVSVEVNAAEASGCEGRVNRRTKIARCQR